MNYKLEAEVMVAFPQVDLVASRTPLHTTAPAAAKDDRWWEGLMAPPDLWWESSGEFHSDKESFL
jgi:hypothetical protein